MDDYIDPNYVKSLEDAYLKAKSINDANAPQGQTSMFGNVKDTNIIEHQIQLDDLLERADHLLRGQKMVYENGKPVWKDADNDDHKIFNEYGVQEILRILSMYLNRNTKLSNYNN